MKGGKHRVGYKLSGALLSPRLLRHRDVTLLADDVFGNDVSSLSAKERAKLSQRSNSCGSVNNTLTASPSILRSKLGKLVPRKDSITSLLSACNLEKKSAKHKSEGLSASTSNLKKVGFVQLSSNEDDVPQRHPSIFIQQVSDSDDVSSESSDDVDVFKFSASQEEGFQDGLTSPPSSLYEGRCSDIARNQHSSHHNIGNDNDSLPFVLSPVPGSLPESTPSSVRTRRKGLVERNLNYKTVLRQNFENQENCCSDSEVTVKSSKSPHFRANSSFSIGAVNRGSENLSIQAGALLQRNLATSSACSTPSSVHNAVEKNRHFQDRVEDCCFPSESRQYPNVAKKEASSIIKSTNGIAISPQQTRSRKDFHSCTESTSGSISPEEAKRAKSLFNSSPSVHHRTPAAARRKSPYKELELHRSNSDTDQGDSSYRRLPTRSPWSKRRTAKRLSDPLERSLPVEERSKAQKPQPKPNRQARRSIAYDSWHPVNSAMANQYEAYHEDRQEKESSKSSKGKSSEDRFSNKSAKSYDEVVFDMVKVPPEEYAKQLTLLDLELFKKIDPDEIVGCGWTKKEKWKLSPNVCAMTQRFNNTSFWVMREILNASTLKIRAEILSHFIKIAKKLHELNNLHSLMAVIQSLNSSSIIRLSATWAMISRSYKSSFDRLLSLVREDENRVELRAHMESIKLPCIPFLGMYLSDVMYITSAFPSTGGMESPERKDKMNNILRVISEYQQSRYDQLQKKKHIMNYLKSVKYIEELERFAEEDNYKLSLKIEPPPPTNVPDEKSRSKFEESNTAKSGGKSDQAQSTTNSSQQKFFPGHRKTKSLGKEYVTDPSSTARVKADSTKLKSRRGSLYSKHKDATEWYISPIKSTPSVLEFDYSGSLPRSNVAGVMTSLLDDSVIATSSNMSSTSSATTSLKAATLESLASSLSNSGSDQSEEMWNVAQKQLSKKPSLPRKGKSPLQWFRQYHNNRVKYIVDQNNGKSPTKSGPKSSTFPLDKTSPLHSLYQSYMKSDRLSRSWQARDYSDSFSLEMDEFVKMRSLDDERSLENIVDDGDDEVKLIADEQSSDTKATKSHSGLSLSPSEVLERACESLSNLSLRLAGHTKAWKQIIKSPKLHLAFRASSRSETDLSPRKAASDRRSSATEVSTLICKYQAKAPVGKSVTAALRSNLELHKTDDATPTFEGSVKRKCVLKHGRKPTMAPWSRYWLSLYGSTLFYFACKNIKAAERSHFKSRPCKVVPIFGWMVLRSNNPEKLDSFQLSDPETGTMYRFQCESSSIALLWASKIKEAAKGSQQPERDLINLDES